MPEATHYQIDHRELVTLIIKSAKLHEGRWVLNVNFGFAAMNLGPEGAHLPSGVVAVQNVGIQRALPDSPDHLVVDAAEVNPKGAKD